MEKYLKEERKIAIWELIKKVYDYDLRQAIYRLEDCDLSAEELYELVKKEYNENVREYIPDFFKIILTNEKCNEQTLRFIIDFNYQNEEIKYEILKLVIEHQNATEELFSYIFELSKCSERFMINICPVIAGCTKNINLLDEILNYEYCNKERVLNHLMFPIIRNEVVTEELILDMLRMLIIYDKTLFYYGQYASFLKEVIKKTKEKKTLELIVSMAMQNNLTYTVEVFETLFESNPKISKALFKKCMKTILKMADILSEKILSENSGEVKESLILDAHTNSITRLIFIFVNSEYDMEHDMLMRIIKYAQTINMSEIGRIVARRKECDEEHLKELLFFGENSMCVSAILENEHRTEEILSALALSDYVELIMGDEKVTADILYKIASCDSWLDYIYLEILNNPKHDYRAEEKILEYGNSTLNYHIAYDSEYVSILRKLSKYEDSEIKYAVFQNPNTPSDIKQKIKEEWTENEDSIPMSMYVSAIEMSLNDN